MNAITLDLAAHHIRRAPPLRDIRQQARDWWHNIRSRTELQNLDDRSLQDIGLTRCSADFEAAKPFWMA
jgi:uncharacterized protein YjiS (DUF1127 family)